MKYQERHFRDEALECFKEASALDPDGTKMMKRDTGEMISCKEMADYQYARTFIVTWGLIDFHAAKEYIRNYPSGQLIKEAYLDVSRFYSPKYEEGRAFFDELIARFPDDPDVLNAYVREIERDYQALEGNSVFYKGAELSDRVLKVYPEVTQFQAAKSCAQFLVWKNEADAAEKVFGEDFFATQVQSWSESLLSYAEFWFKQKRNSKTAEEAVIRALNFAPEDPEVLRRAAAVYHSHLGKPEKALEIFGPDTLARISTDARALYDYFRFWMTLKTNMESAEDALKILLELKPDTVYYRISAAGVYRKTGLVEKALDVFGPDFVSGRQDDMPALYEYGMYWIRYNLNLESAVPALTRALSRSPRKSTDHWRAAVALAKIKKMEAALEVYGPSYLPYIKEDALALSQYSRYWIERKLNRKSAIEALEIAIRLKNLSTFDRNRLAYIFVQAGMLDRAEKFYGPEYLLKINDDPQALYFYSSFWGHRDKNLPSALEASEHACKIDKDNPKQWSTKARILKGLGRNEEALKALEKAIGLEKYKEDKDRHEPLRKELLEALEKKICNYQFPITLFY
jgi:tetratricopeptide (TPR) repeat protein